MNEYEPSMARPWLCLFLVIVILAMLAKCSAVEIDAWIELSGSVLAVKWRSEPGVRYNVERSTDLLDWSLLYEAVNGNGSTNTVIDFTFAQRGFYRVSSTNL